MFYPKKILVESMSQEDFLLKKELLPVGFNINGLPCFEYHSKNLIFFSPTLRTDGSFANFSFHLPKLLIGYYYSIIEDEVEQLNLIATCRNI